MRFCTWNICNTSNPLENCSFEVLGVCKYITFTRCFLSKYNIKSSLTFQEIEPMDFPSAPHIVYPRNTLMAVLCDFRFPKILKINHLEPHELQDILRGKGYTEFHVTVSMSPEVLSTGTVQVAQIKTFHFFSPDHGWRISLSSEHIALTCSRWYRHHDEFKEKLSEMLHTFSDVYNPSEFRRIGLRYQNVVNSTSLPTLKGIEWHEVVPAKIFPELHESIGKSIKTLEKMMRLEGDDMIAQVIYAYGEMAGTFEGTDFNQPSYSIDIDCFVEKKLEATNVLSHYDSLRRKVYDIFHYSISPTIQDGLQSPS
jgi:uncharacterized protein (TIGR04255 family)